MNAPVPPSAETLRSALATLLDDLPPRQAAQAIDTAGKAVLISGENRLEIEGVSKKRQDAVVDAWIQALSASGPATASAVLNPAAPADPAPLEGSTGVA